MSGRPTRLVCAVLTLAMLLATQSAVMAQTGTTTESWVGTWATAVVARPPQVAAPQSPAPKPPLHFNNQTLRQIVRTSIGGDRIRVVLSNAFGTAPLPIGAARVALRDKGPAIVSNSNRGLTFGGGSATSIPPGAVIVSDPVILTVPAFADLAVDIFLPGDTAVGTSPVTMHTAALQTNYVSQPGNHTGASELPVASTTASWFFLARVEVVAPRTTGAVVTFGDSITDGTASTVDTNNRWPNHLARRLAAQKVNMAVLNVGIAGNRVLSDGAGVNALARFDRDVVAQPGVTHLIVLEGINDVGMARENPRPSAAQLIAGHRQIIARARARGLRVYGATLLPCEGVIFAGYWTPEGEKTRQALNEWIRTSKEYDGVIDFDAVMRDPNAPARILSKYDSGDRLHPNDAGYQAMADAVNLELLKGGGALQRTGSR